jgi:hypothetical protein
MSGTRRHGRLQPSKASAEVHARLRAIVGDFLMREGAHPGMIMDGEWFIQTKCGSLRVSVPEACCVDDLVTIYMCFEDAWAAIERLQGGKPERWLPSGISENGKWNIHTSSNTRRRMLKGEHIEVLSTCAAEALRDFHARMLRVL